MTDSEIVRVWFDLLDKGLKAQSAVNAIYSSIEIIRAYQPTKQGIEPDAAVYFQKITDVRYGFQSRSTSTSSNGDLVKTESQLYESTYQFTAYMKETPVTSSPPYPAPITASDIANTAAMILQGYDAIEELAKIGAGILRVGDVRMPYFVNDRDNFEGMPNFDITISYSRKLQTVIPSAKTAEYKIYRV
jgi:hypothetical protein